MASVLSSENEPRIKKRRTAKLAATKSQVAAVSISYCIRYSLSKCRKRVPDRIGPNGDVAGIDFVGRRSKRRSAVAFEERSRDLAENVPAGELLVISVYDDGV